MEEKNRIISFFKQPLIYVLIFCIFIQVQIYKTVPQYVLTNDSTTYTTGYTGSITQGKVDPLRTPVYPSLVKIIKTIGGEENLNSNIVKFQKLLFIISLILFCFCLKQLTKNNVIIALLTIVFGICPSILLWNITILTESVSIFEIVLLSFLTIRYLKKPSSIISGAIRNSVISYDYD